MYFASCLKGTKKDAKEELKRMLNEEEEGDDLMVYDSKGEKNQERENVNSRHFKSAATREKVS